MIVKPLAEPVLIQTPHGTLTMTHEAHTFLVDGGMDGRGRAQSTTVLGSVVDGIFHPYDLTKEVVEIVGDDFVEMVAEGASPQGVITSEDVIAVGQTVKVRETERRRVKEEPVRNNRPGRGGNKGDQ